MRILTLLSSALAGFTLFACEAEAPPPTWWDMDVPAQDFVVLPCGSTQSSAPCAMVVAGGKRILAGAPAGVVASLREVDLKQLDGVLIFSLHAENIEGLDEVRNRSWLLGRSQPLRVVGPTGLGDVVAGLNLTYEQADALFVVENGIPPGGYDAAILISVEAISGDLVFDTGDLAISRTRQGFDVQYRGEYQLSLCANSNVSIDGEPVAEGSMEIGCAARQWPLIEPVFVSAN